eukprot:1429034-Pyramimonas_sp.AAC.1
MVAPAPCGTSGRRQPCARPAQYAPPLAPASAKACIELAWYTSAHGPRDLSAPTRACPPRPFHLTQAVQ